MSRPISKKQFFDLWFEEFATERSMSAQCILCGQTGFIDTRGKVFNKNGTDTGGQALCICPNGRAFARKRDANARREGKV